MAGIRLEARWRPQRPVPSGAVRVVCWSGRRSVAPSADAGGASSGKREEIGEPNEGAGFLGEHARMAVLRLPRRDAGLLQGVLHTQRVRTQENANERHQKLV